VKLSEATLQWEHWRARRRRRRHLKAWGGTTAFVLALLALAAWGGLPRIFNVGEKGEAIAVKLGNPDGEDLPLKVSAVPDQVMQAVMSAQRQLAMTTVEETRTAVPEVPAEPVPAPAAAKSESKPAVKPATPAPTPAPAKPAAPAEAQPTITEKVIRGNEKGNASELILKPQGEKISQNIYSPAYLYMPLPVHLDLALLTRVKATEGLDGKVLYSADENRARLLEVYTRGADLALGTDPGIRTRPAIWAILEAAGYDLANADYKKGNTLKPVVITFRIGVPVQQGDNPELLEVKLEQSSGNQAVDEAVLFAFRGSGFANGTGQVAQGRYTYDFSAKK
jgi:hypothetical protein